MFDGLFNLRKVKCLLCVHPGAACSQRLAPGASLPGEEKPTEVKLVQINQQLHQAAHPKAKPIWIFSFSDVFFSCLLASAEKSAMLGHLIAVYTEENPRRNKWQEPSFQGKSIHGSAGSSKTSGFITVINRVWQHLQAQLAAGSLRERWVTWPEDQLNGEYHVFLLNGSESFSKVKKLCSLWNANEVCWFGRSTEKVQRKQEGFIYIWNFSNFCKSLLWSFEARRGCASM